MIHTGENRPLKVSNKPLQLPPAQDLHPKSEARVSPKFLIFYKITGGASSVRETPVQHSEPIRAVLFHIYTWSIHHIIPKGEFLKELNGEVPLVEWLSLP